MQFAYLQTYSHDGPPECSYLYAEIDVVAKRKNKVPEPSSTEDIDHHVYICCTGTTIKSDSGA